MTTTKRSFPPGWDEQRVREVIAHYDNQTEDEQFAEIEPAHEAEQVTDVRAPGTGARSPRAAGSQTQRITAVRSKSAGQEHRPIFASRCPKPWDESTADTAGAHVTVRRCHPAAETGVSGL